MQRQKECDWGVMVDWLAPVAAGADGFENRWKNPRSERYALSRRV